MLDLLLCDSLPSDDEAWGDVERFVDRTLRFYSLCGVTGNAVLDDDELILAADIALRFVKNYKEPSWFKNTAVFTLAIASRKPFKTPLPEAFNPIRSEQNIVLGLLESLYWLNGAELMTQEGHKKIVSPIQFSDHFFTELVQAIAFASQNFEGNFQEADDRSKACLLALIFESIAYKTNNHIPYKNNSLMDCAQCYFLPDFKPSKPEVTVKV
jgi:hypothetical protein